MDSRTVISDDRHLFVTDGPHGVRKARHTSGAFGLADAEPSTAFPTSATLAKTYGVLRTTDRYVFRAGHSAGFHPAVRKDACVRNGSHRR